MQREFIYMMLKTTATKKGVAGGATINPFLPSVPLLEH
jgi:hypothetical protein